MSALRYGSVCSGIEAATVAWHPLGWRPQFFSEVAAAPRAVLAHHYPEVPCHGDFTTIQAGDFGAIDLLVGGTPCQDFSLAGLRAGLDGERGNLTLEFGRLARRLRPRWFVWENVPGVLSSNGGRDFGSVLGLFAGRALGVPRGGWQNAGIVPGLGSAYGLAWRVLDAQYVRVDGFGRAVPQRRRRVFVVGYLGDWRRAAAVLLERAGLCGDLAPRRGAEEIAAASLTGSLGRRCGQPDGGDTEGHLIAQATAPTLDASFGRLQGASGQDANHGHGHLVAFGGNDTRGPIQVATALNAHGGLHGRMDFESETFVAQTLRARDGSKGVDSDCTDTLIAFNARQNPDVTWDRAGSLGSSSPQAEAVAYAIQAGALRENPASGPDGVGVQRAIAYTLEARAEVQAVSSGWAVRRLTPLECERLQGFPDDYTLVPHGRGLMADGPRYKALGNSMACNVMRWIGRRIDMVESLGLDGVAA